LPKKQGNNEGRKSLDLLKILQTVGVRKAPVGRDHQTKGEMKSHLDTRPVATSQAKTLTYDKSNGVAGCEPVKLCAKLTFPPPICLAAPGGTLALPPKGMPPNAHPAALPTGPTVNSQPLFLRNILPPESATALCVLPHLSSRSVTDSTRRGPIVAAAAVGLRTRRVCRGATVVQPLKSQSNVSTSRSRNDVRDGVRMEAGDKGGPFKAIQPHLGYGPPQ
jgi:hypothetical protein